jgi:predicted ATPase/class 3 adenylate cyclase
MSDATANSFLFTDIEGSTRLVVELGDAYGPVLDAHHRLARQAIASHHGTEVSTKGDSFFVLFARALDAVLAAADFQRALAGHAWPSGVQVRARMGIHAGHAIVVGGEYVGFDIHRAARIADAANGGQVLLSDTALKAVADRLPAGLTIVDAGRHRLKDVGTEHLWRLRIDGLTDDLRPPRSIETAPTNLPVEPTRLVDREAECRDLQALIVSARVVTMTGPGGVGKSRVAVHAARDAAPAFPDGVFYLDLALVNDLDLALQRMAEVLGLRPSLAESPLNQVIEELRPRRLLILLDTADRVAGLGATLGVITAATPMTCVLVTSRSPLRIAAEHEYPLGPLAAQGPGDGEPGPAVALFLERARAARPGIAVAGADLETIAAICDRVDRLPLAIELAAARVRTLSPAAILARLTRLLPVLTGGAADAPARQRTLRDTIAWSYGLLDAADQDLLQRVAVFASSFELDAAEAIAGPRPDMLDALERLVDRSLLTAAPTAEPRFRLLGAIRELAAEMLDASAAAAPVREAHARYCLGAVERWTAAIGSAEEAAALGALEQAGDDSRAALAWALVEPVEPNRAALAVGLAARLGRFWWIRGRIREGSAWLERALDHAEAAAPGVRADALYWAGVLLDDLGDPAGAVRRLDAALAIQRAAGDEAGAAGTLNSLGVVAYSLGDFDRAEQLLRESLAVKKRLGLDRVLATTLSNLAVVAAGRRRYEESIALYEEALEHDARIGSHGAESFTRAGLGAVRIWAGDDRAGVADLRAAIPQLAELGAMDALAEALDAFGEAAVHADRPGRAARLLLAARELRARESVVQRPAEAERAARLVADVEASLPASEAEAAHADARAMDVAAAVAYALAD